MANGQLTLYPITWRKCTPTTSQDPGECSETNYICSQKTVLKGLHMQHHITVSDGVLRSQQELHPVLAAVEWVVVMQCL